MSVKPIIYKTEMVRAILDGRKTATRIVIKLPEGFPKHSRIIGPQSGSGLYTIFTDDPDWELQALKDNKLTFKPPYEPGDILYVRETYAYCSCSNCDGDSGIGICSRRDNREEPTGCYIYKADNNNLEWDDKKTYWNPSIHMPKEAARIWLKVTDVRVEQLQDMGRTDFLKEGLTLPHDEHTDLFLEMEFKHIWDSTIKKKDLPIYGREVNPWVFVIEFERIKKPDEN